MDFKAPKGVVWSAKYSTTGGRRFSTLGLGFAWKPGGATSAMPLGTGLMLRRNSEMSSDDAGLPHSGQTRAQSAPIKAVHRNFGDGLVHAPGSGNAASGSGRAVIESSHLLSNGPPPSPARTRRIMVSPARKRPEEDKEAGKEGEGAEEAGEGKAKCQTPQGKVQEDKSATAPPSQLALLKARPPRSEHRPVIIEHGPPVLDWSEKCMEWVAEISTSGVNVGRTVSPKPRSPSNISRVSSAQSRDWTSSGVTPLWAGQGMVPDLMFGNELWYKKGYKLIKNRRGSDGGQPERARSTGDNHLHCPTASSRARQVTATPSAHTEPDHKAGRYHRKSLPSNKFHIPADRFKGTRQVSADELKKIVERLSTCDPTRVPDSGRSKGARPINIRSYSWQGVRASIGLP